MSDLPPADALSDLADAALDSAIRLWRDADHLLTAGSAPTAHSLAVLAMEEAGKAIICDTAASRDPSITRKKLSEKLRNHPAKLEEAIWIRDQLDAMTNLLRALEADGQIAPVEDDAEVLTPSPEQEAEALADLNSA